MSVAVALNVVHVPDLVLERGCDEADDANDDDADLWLRTRRPNVFFEITVGQPLPIVLDNRKDGEDNNGSDEVQINVQRVDADTDNETEPTDTLFSVNLTRKFGIVALRLRYIAVSGRAQTVQPMSQEQTKDKDTNQDTKNNERSSSIEVRGRGLCRRASTQGLILLARGSGALLRIRLEQRKRPYAFMVHAIQGGTIDIGEGSAEQPPAHVDVLTAQLSLGGRLHCLPHLGVRRFLALKIGTHHCQANVRCARLHCHKQIEVASGLGGLLGQCVLSQSTDTDSELGVDHSRQWSLMQPFLIDEEGLPLEQLLAEDQDEESDDNDATLN